MFSIAITGSLLNPNVYFSLANLSVIVLSLHFLEFLKALKLFRTFKFCLDRFIWVFSELCYNLISNLEFKLFTVTS